MSLFYGVLCGFFSMSGEEACDGLEIGDDGVSHMRERGDTLICGFGISCATCVADENGYDAQIGGVSACWLDADLEGDSGEDEAADAAVAQRELERCSFEGGHGELVEDGF